MKRADPEGRRTTNHQSARDWSRFSVGRRSDGGVESTGSWMIEDMLTEVDATVRRGRGELMHCH